MFESPLSLILVLLAASVFVVTLARRLGLPSILGYVTVGLVLGPHALGVFPESETTHLLAELGVVFLLFTLGLEFSWPRMVALRREVFGLGSLQVFGTATAVARARAGDHAMRARARPGAAPDARVSASSAGTGR
jgi:CPA2 family monovalent cation:H+ antiporter-2